MYSTYSTNMLATKSTTPKKNYLGEILILATLTFCIATKRRVPAWVSGMFFCPDPTRTVYSTYIIVFHKQDGDFFMK